MGTRIQSMNFGLARGLTAWGDVPWQQLVEAINRMIGNATEHVAKISVTVRCRSVCRSQRANTLPPHLVVAVRPSEERISVTMQLCAFKTQIGTVKKTARYRLQQGNQAFADLRACRFVDPV
jgi:hypothetical protein